jgi:hypothetical protein
MRVVQSEIVAQHVKERRVRIGGDGMGLTVNVERKLLIHVWRVLPSNAFELVIAAWTSNYSESFGLETGIPEANSWYANRAWI